MIQEQGCDLNDSYHQDAQNDEDQMIISGDSIDRYLKSDLNNEEVNSGAGAVPKMSNLIIAMALQNNFCPQESAERQGESETPVNNSVVDN